MGSSVMGGGAVDSERGKFSGSSGSGFGSDMAVDISYYTVWCMVWNGKKLEEVEDEVGVKSGSR